MKSKTPNLMNTYLQKSLNEGAIAIMLKDAIANINYFNYYKDYENRNPDIRIKRGCLIEP